MGVSLYSVLLYCNKEGFDLFHFHTHLLQASSMRTIIQATKNNIVLAHITDYENMENVKQFYLTIKRSLNLELEDILGFLLSASEVQSMLNIEWPFLSDKSPNVSKTGIFCYIKWPHMTNISIRPVPKHTPSPSAGT